MTSPDSLIRSSFEEWANKYWRYGWEDDWNDLAGRFTNHEVNDAWEAYREATRKLLESLVLGVEATKEGAAVCLMAKMGGEHVGAEE